MFYERSCKLVDCFPTCSSETHNNEKQTLHVADQLAEPNNRPLKPVYTVVIVAELKPAKEEKKTMPTVLLLHPRDHSAQRSVLARTL